MPTGLSHQFWIWECIHCTGAYALGAYKLGAYRLGVYGLEPPILDLEMHSLQWSLHTGGLQAGAYRLEAYRLEPPILNLEIHSLHWGLHTGGLQAGEPTGGGPTGLSHRFWIWGCTRCTGAHKLGPTGWGLQAGSGYPLSPRPGCLLGS